MEENLLSRRLNKFHARRGEYFNLWSLRFEALLESKDLLGVVSTDPLSDTTFADLDSDIRTELLKAKSLLVQSLGDKPLRKVASERKNVSRMYQKLNERYDTQITATRVQLQTELYQKSFSKN